MTTKPTPSPARIIAFVVFAIVMLLLSLGLCSLLLPRYEKVESEVFLAEAISAYFAGEDRAVAESTQAIALDPKSTQAYLYRGSAYSKKGDNDRAIADFTQALQLAPQDEQLLFNLGDAYETKGDFKNALATYNRLIAAHPKSSMAYNDYAWLLATCPQAEFRDGKKALDYATVACELSGWKDPAVLDTLASAYAEEGDFDDAVKWENAALALPDFDATDAEGAKARLVLYQNHQPYHRDQ